MNVHLRITPQTYGEAERNLEQLARRIGRAAMRQAVGKASTPFTRRAKQLVPRRYGILKKSIGRRIRTYKARDEVAVIIGPRRGFKQPDPAGGDGYVDPARYGHLVERGTSHSAPQPFLRPAFEQGKAESLRIYRREIGAAIAKAAARMTRRRPL